MKNTKTFQNLMNSFAGESQARNRYRMFASIAKNEGWHNIASIFEETAENEYYHAKEFYSLLVEMVGEENLPEMMEVNGSYPIARKSTYDNLTYAADGENEEVTVYAEFAQVAKEEGFSKVASKFKLIAAVEAHHANRYEKVAQLLKAEELLNKEESTSWKCMKCGHIHSGKKAPGVCPICSYEAGYFEKFELNV
ncbi:MAG: rubrerythrin [Bacilli bacterium]